ncbi:MAG: group II truncated hemoglobin [Solimonas sp.]
MTISSFYEQLGRDETVIRRLVDAFYDRMDRDPAYAELRRLHPPSLQGSRDKLFWFLCGWTGGEPHYIRRFGHPRLRARHLPFAIADRERDQWLACMKEALAEAGIEPALRRQLYDALAPVADWMRNQPE